MFGSRSGGGGGSGEARFFPRFSIVFVGLLGCSLSVSCASRAPRAQLALCVFVCVCVCVDTERLRWPVSDPTFCGPNRRFCVLIFEIFRVVT